uniref:Uncharacterized protein n=1 Tax=Timema cristinae TaxID=61476 RepID=A0A7R9D630_TIMCR|nr:unnamed protein product [Timema cristinae]
MQIQHFTDLRSIKYDDQEATCGHLEESGFDLNSNHVEIEASNCTYDVGEEGGVKFLLQDGGQELLPGEVRI